MMTTLSTRYRREDWFGPESFGAVVIGMLVMSLPFTGLASRDALWLVVGPPLTGLVLLALSTAPVRGVRSVRRAGTGLVAGGAGAIISIPVLLAGAALGSAIA
ncbi:hypothetical protein C5O27_20890 [Gordonia alkanivorans]|nr:hypothetical protein C5O27_20890 [Gordonia alkanivorans]QGP87326.1 hypothetical protein GKZ92_06535 [Gordonia sp. 135]